MKKFTIALIMAAVLLIPACVLVADEANAESTVTLTHDDVLNFRGGTYKVSHSEAYAVSLIPLGSQSLDTLINSTIPSNGSLTIKSGAYMVYVSDHSSVDVTFSADPIISSSPGTATSDAKTHSSTTWLVGATLGNGTYCSSGKIIFVPTGSNSDKFVKDIVLEGKNLDDAISRLSDYGAIRGTDEYNQTLVGTYSVFYYESANNPNKSVSFTYKQLEGDHYEVKSLSLHVYDDSMWYRIYAYAYQTLTICVDGTFGGNMYLVGDDGSCYVLERGQKYEITPTAAANYYLNVDDGSGENINFKISVSGVPPADNMGLIFAILCVVLCAVIFGTMAFLGKKPSWATKD